MKTIIKGGAALLIGVTLALGGCQKEEILTKASDNVPAYRLAAPYSIILIDHQPARTELPAYRIEVKSNGEVMFHGISRTAHTGFASFNLPREKVEQIRELLAQTNLTDLPDLPFVPDLPLAITTFREFQDSEPIMRIEYIGSPGPLAQIREKVEGIIGIDAWIYSDKSDVENVVTNRM